MLKDYEDDLGTKSSDTTKLKIDNLVFKNDNQVLKKENEKLSYN
jgi:hypothetical protein